MFVKISHPYGKDLTELLENGTYADQYNDPIDVRQFMAESAMQIDIHRSLPRRKSEWKSKEIH